MFWCCQEACSHKSYWVIRNSHSFLLLLWHCIVLSLSLNQFQAMYQSMAWTEVACKVKPCPTRASKRTIMVPLYQAFHHGSYPLWGSISSGEFQGPNVRICCSDIRPIRRISTESSLSSVQTSSHNTDTHVNNMFALISVVDVSAYQLTGWTLTILLNT